MSHSSEKEIIELLDYALKLENEGRFEDALIVYNDAYLLGSDIAEDKIVKISRFLDESGFTDEKTVSNSKNKKKNSHFSNSFKNSVVFVFAFLVITALPVIVFFLNNITNVEGDNSNSSIFSNLFNTTIETNNQEIFLHVIGNALNNFKQERGYYPNEVTDIIRYNPENWLSYLPEEITYVTDNSSFILTVGNQTLESTYVKPLSLILYPSHNQLALQLGDEILFNFLVSSPSTPYSSQEEFFVTNRTAFPNGFGSFYGTRALSLSNGFGISGTNNPIEVGYRNTNGSIVMNNSDIDVLFPYISIGTKFSISLDAPKSATFKNFLPNITPDDWNFVQETNDDLIFSWQ